MSPVTPGHAVSRFVTRRPGATRFDWWRAHHGLPSHPRWLSTARKANVSVSVAFSVAMWMLDSASRGKPRGSIAEFSACACAAYLNIEEGEVERVVSVLKETGWIDGHEIVNWDERQPQREDPGAAERKAAERARRQADVTDSHAASRCVTASSDKNKKKIDTSSSEQGTAREAPAEPQKGSRQGSIASPQLVASIREKGWAAPAQDDDPMEIPAYLRRTT